MNESETGVSPTSTTSTKPTQLPKIGCLIGLLGLAGTPALIFIARGMADGTGHLTTVQRVLLLLTDGTRLLVLVGLAVFVIGLIRRGKERRQGVK